MRTILLLALLAATVPAVAQPLLPSDRPATLPELRAALGTPTVLRIEIDYMVEYNANGTVNHSHRPTADEINAVVQMFACQGITLTIVVDDEIAHHNVLRRDPNNSSNFFGYNSGTDTFGGIKAANFDRGSGWHYGVFAHQYQNSSYQTTGSSGLGEVPGNDFIVTLGSFDNEIGTPWDRAATLAHEFGHNLGLGHAGSMSAGTVGTYVPNVPSVMTYFTQLSGIRSANRCFGTISDDAGETLLKEMDYSHGHACSVNESALNESRGLGIVPVDWNCDGDATDTSVAQDIGEQRDGWCGSSAGLDALSDYDEWSNIVDVAALDASRYVSQEIACVTADESAAFASAAATAAAARGGCTQPTPTVESCTSRRMVYLNNSGTTPVGTCRLPARTLTEALPFLQNGNILYAQPGSYSTTGAVLDQPVQILGPGGAVFGD